MSVVVPTVTAYSPAEYKEQIEKVSDFTDRIHIDLMDGEFAPTFSVGVSDLWAPEGWTVDIHVMAHRLDEYMSKLVGLRPNLIIVHAESKGDVSGALSQIQRAGIKAGLALLRPTVPATIAPLIKTVEHIMIFSGDLGHFGGVANLMQLEKIRLIKLINPNVEIGWDGGVTIDNAYSLTQGGVDVLNVGGAVHRAGDPRAAFTKLQQEIAKTGVI